MKKLIYIINDGDIFEGTVDQFRDCFFDNADIDTVIGWCAEQDYDFQCTYREIDNEH